MGMRIVIVAKSFLESMFVEGGAHGDGEAIRLEHGLPEGSKLINWQIYGGYLHCSFRTSQEDNLILEFEPKIDKVKVAKS